MVDKSSFKVLVVEDDETIAAMYTERLSEEGYSTLWVDDGAKSLETITNQRPHAVLLDIMLPNQNGLEILKEIRSNPELTTLPVLVLSAFPRPEFIESVNALNALGFFNKAATTPSEIIYTINSALLPE